MSVCPRCGGPLDPATSAYDESGTLICRTCNSHQASSAAGALITRRDPTTARNLYGGAAASLFLGLVTCVSSALGIFFFLAAPLPIFTGFATLRALFGDTTSRQRLGAGYFLVIAMSVVGIGFGLLAICIGVLVLALSSEAPHLHVH